ncbi:MAG: hypothetical protein AABW84_00580 [Nanoarchaeota archaeon]
MTVFSQRNETTKNLDDILNTIDPRIRTITHNFIKEYTKNSAIEFVHRKINIVKRDTETNIDKKGFAITGILLEHTADGPKPLISGRIDIFNSTDYVISINYVDKSYISQARALTDRLEDELKYNCK